jgi:hypothetical protein
MLAMCFKIVRVGNFLLSICTNQHWQEGEESDILLFFYKLKSWRIVTKTSSHLKLNLVIIFFSKYITFCYKMKVSYFKATNKIKSFMKFYIYVIFYSKKIVNSGKIKKRKSKQRYFSQSCNLVFLVWTNFVEGFFWSEELKIMLKRSERLILVTFRDVFCSNKLLSSLTR